ncbi:MAG TPA: M4 family metallopeptidase [Polyangia bacterium]|jgi:Zn-dependent metalloprotease
MSFDSCAICHIIPSSVLRKLALHPDLANERDALLRSADAAAFARGERSVSRFAALAAVRGTTGTKHRDIFDAGGKSTLPGKLVRTEGGPAAADASANEAYDSTGTTYDFYSEMLRRNSVDGRGLKLESTVHSGKAPDNAFWNGSRMVFGDATPNGPFTGSFAGTIDVVAHELTHGVTQYTVPGGGLDYVDQSGALNESWSDVFGSVVKQWSKKQTAATADWLIGAGIMKPRFGKALRSMKDPGTAWTEDDQPKDMSGYVEGGDVHTNSGIPNRAFYLAAAGLAGSSWEKAGPIWYKALSLLTPQATFADAAKATEQAATLLFGKDEVAAVTQAWKTVKVI